MIELKEVASRWKYIGIALGLYNHELCTIAAEGKSVIDCLTDMVELWLNQNYDVSMYGEPSYKAKKWQVLV